MWKIYFNMGVSMCEEMCEENMSVVSIFAYSEKLRAEIANWSEHTNKRTNEQTWAVSWVALQLKSVYGRLGYPQV